MLVDGGRTSSGMQEASLSRSPTRHKGACSSRPGVSHQDHPDQHLLPLLLVCKVACHEPDSDPLSTATAALLLSSNLLPGHQPRSQPPLITLLMRALCANKRLMIPGRGTELSLRAHVAPVLRWRTERLQQSRTPSGRSRRGAQTGPGVRETSPKARRC